MSKIVLQAENISKQYRLGQLGTGTISHDVNRWWYKVRGKEDPYLKIGDTNDRSQKGGGDYVWSLKDINFEVQQGEVLGIIGKNGAGKSTLLKILSQVTTPTTGEVKVKGRIAALLEVGTGFHPDLSGRENIFLNGAILGMSKAEIKSKLDEIVDFSGVAKYLDTPVKRYSSGMMVRLGFAVAAHLEPEILIVDEVLAVGDAEFQKKCLGKMKAVSGQGRTVLFVSHNMTAINTLCSKCLFLKNGEINSIGPTNEIVDKYLSNESSSGNSVYYKEGEKPGDETAILNYARVIDDKESDITYAYREQRVGIEFCYEVLKEGNVCVPNIHVFNSSMEYAFVGIENETDFLAKKGTYKTIMWIPDNLLNEGKYVFGIALTTMQPTVKVHFFEQEALVLDVLEDIGKRNTSYNQKLPGVLRPLLNWKTNYIS